MPSPSAEEEARVALRELMDPDVIHGYLHQEGREGLRVARDTAIDAYRRAIVSRCLEAVEAEPELPGPMPVEIAVALSVNAEEVCRAFVRATKRNISARLTSLLSETP